MIVTARKQSKYGVFPGPYFRVFGPEKNSVFGHFSRSELDYNHRKVNALVATRVAVLKFLGNWEI